MMSVPSLNDEPAMVIPFKRHEHDGRVAIYYGKNNDPVKVGFDINLCRGFPVISARVDYSGLGYRQLFGWIQIVTDEYYKSREEREVPKSIKCVDLVPSMLTSGVPFAHFGYLPEFFDAPCYNIGN
jgi:hypothetical protein